MIGQDKVFETYICTGEISEFPITFPHEKDTLGSAINVLVYHKYLADDLEYRDLLTKDVDYTIDGDKIFTILTYPEPDEVILERSTGLLQETSFLALQRIDTRTFEAIVDKLTLIAQELNKRRVNALRVPIEEDEIILPTAARRALKLLGFNEDGDPIPVSGVSEVPVSDWAATLVAALNAAAARTILDVYSKAEVDEVPLFYKGQDGITENATIPAGDENYMSIGPIAIADGVTVTVEGEWVII